MPTTSAAPPPPELIAFVEKQIRDAADLVEDRRAETRFQYAAHVVAWPVDKNGHSIDASFPLVTRDISSHGVSLVSVDAIPHERLATRFELGGETVSLIVEILWTRLYGPFYLVGGRFAAWLPQIREKLPSMQPIQIEMERLCESVGKRSVPEPCDDESVQVDAPEPASYPM